MSAYRYRLLGLLGAALLAACSSAPRNVPIEDRSPGKPPAPASAPAPKPAAEPAAATPTRDGKDGFYTVQRGDTLHSIALAQGRDWRDIARWNGIEDPNKIRVGQVLRVAPQPTDKPSDPVAAAAPVAPATSVQARPLGGAAPSAPAPGVPAPTATVPPAPEPAKPAAGAAAAASGIEWLWPLKGPVLEQFNETRNKGIDIGGKEGEPVVAAGDGQVVYVGNGLRGYGNLVILKHDDDFVSAYAHNREVLVKKDAHVKRGQKIAEVGRTDADRPKLHFEIRRAGKPLDPLTMLPPQ
jgi:lipoprotein NlpD